jgi:putative transposase
VINLYSSKVIGWATGHTLGHELELDAVLMVVKRRKPCNTIIHSDQGSQYDSDDGRRFCEKNHLEPSRSQRGNCWDNAVFESFFNTLKQEGIKKKIYKKRQLAKEGIKDYVEAFYKYRTPSQLSRWDKLDAFEAYVLKSSGKRAH